MDIVLQILANPIGLFIVGALIGWVFCWFSGMKSRRVMKHQIQELERKDRQNTELVGTQAKALLNDNKALASEVEQLKERINNLKTTVAALSNKPSSQEVMTLRRYQSVVEAMTEKVPGFAQSWQSTLSEMQEEEKRIFGGFSPLVKKLIPVWNTKKAANNRLQIIDDGES
jgi:predicted  nucleic acid-binding Zn-ribbon protein